MLVVRSYMQCQKKCRLRGLLHVVLQLLLGHTLLFEGGGGAGMRVE